MKKTLLTHDESFEVRYLIELALKSIKEREGKLDTDNDGRDYKYTSEIFYPMTEVDVQELKSALAKLEKVIPYL